MKARCEDCILRADDCDVRCAMCGREYMEMFTSYSPRIPPEETSEETSGQPEFEVLAVTKAPTNEAAVQEVLEFL